METLEIIGLVALFIGLFVICGFISYLAFGNLGLGLYTFAALYILPKEWQKAKKETEKEFKEKV